MKSWSYIAGFWDGEGTICIVRQNRRNINFYPRVFVSNCDRRILRIIKRSTGGTIIDASSGHPKHWKKLYRLLIATEDIPRVLSHLLFHLTVKRQQAILLLQALDKGLTYDRFRRMQKLNKKGR